MSKRLIAGNPVLFLFLSVFLFLLFDSEKICLRYFKICLTYFKICPT